MTTFKCSLCAHVITALEGRTHAICEKCGARVVVPEVSEVTTLTLDELRALKDHPEAKEV